MSFQQALSGLNSASKQLDVIGNNVANSSTVGYKGSQAQFADAFAASLSGSGSSNIGLGQKIGAVMQEFSQGNITATSNPLDMAINGQGFFRLSNNGTISYTRGGQFQMDKNGAIMTASGAKLTGYNIDSTTGLIVTTNPQPLVLPVTDLAPLATGASAAGTGVTASMNLDSRLAVPTSTTFSTADPSSYNNSTSATIYDSLGNAHAFSMYFVKSSTAGDWTLYTSVDGLSGDFPNSTADVTTVKTQATALGTGGSVALDTAATNVSTNMIVGNGVGATEATAAATAATAATNAAAAATVAVNAMDTPPTATQINAAIAAVKTAAAAAATLKDKANLAWVSAGSPGAGVVFTANQAAIAADTAAQAALAAQTAALSPTVTIGGSQSATMQFDGNGKLTTTMPLTIAVDLDAVGIYTGTSNSAATPLTYTLDFTGTTQFGSSFSVNALAQDGYASGSLSGFNVGSDGVIKGRYSNGQTKSLGQVVMAGFRNVQGLKPLGDNQWAESSDSGQPLVNTPGTNALGVLQSSAVEDSNVDLTGELVKMITAQRVYQANAQSIKTQDAVMQTLLNLR